MMLSLEKSNTKHFIWCGFGYIINMRYKLRFTTHGLFIEIHKSVHRQNLQPADNLKTV